MKLELISRLSKLLYSKDQSTDDNWSSKFVVKWKDFHFTESIIENIKKSRILLSFRKYKRVDY